MQLQEAIALIQSPRLVLERPAVWADLGCGTGLFSRALATLLPPASHIYAIDTDSASLQRIARPDHVTLETIQLDFVRDDWPFLAADGLLMANSLHFVADKRTFVEKAGRHLTETGCFLLVEYDTNRANPWVPYPISYVSLRQLFRQMGYPTVEPIHQMPSRYGQANLYGVYVSR